MSQTSSLVDSSPNGSRHEPDPLSPNWSDNEGESNDTQTSLDVVVQEILPFLIKPNFEGELRKRLTSLGVNAVGHLRHLKWETDLGGLVSTIQCRILEEKFSQGAACPSQSSVTANGAFDYCRNQLFPGKLLNQLKGKVRLSTKARLKVIAVVGDDMEGDISRARPPGASDCERVAKQLTAKFPAALNDTSGWRHLATQLFNHIEYLRREERTKKRAASTALGPEELAKKRAKGSQKDMYGIEPSMFLPDKLPDGECRESQAAKKKALQQANLRDSTDMAKVRKEMTATFESQRASIVMGGTVEGILEEWPFLGKHEIMKLHFYKLMGRDETECMNNWKMMRPRFVSFLRTQADKPHKSEQLPEKQADLIRVLKDLTGEDDSDITVAIMSLITLLDVRSEKMFIRFEDVTSFDEMAASSDIPATPFIAVRGNDLLKCKCFVFVDKCSLFPEELSFHEAVLSAFMAHYIFSIHYAKEVAVVWEFIQRHIFQIDGKGSKVERAKRQRQPPIQQPKLLGLMKKYDDYCSKWQ